MGTVLELSAVSKRYRRGPLVVDRVCLEVERGALVQLRGGNGSGKSTLLRVACGFTRPTSGRARRTAAAFGFVPDRAVPPQRMTARGYLERLGGLAGLRPRAVSDRAEALADALGLVPGLDAPLGDLSRGNQRKVLLAQALMRPADLLVLDEPFTALDATAATALAALVQARLDGGCGVLVALHGEELGRAGRVLVLEDGRVHEAAAGGGTGEPPALVVVELSGPQPDGAPGEPLPDGRTRYRVAESAVDGFLRAALAAGSRVLRVGGPDAGPGGGQ